MRNARGGASFAAAQSHSIMKTDQLGTSAVGSIAEKEWSEASTGHANSPAPMLSPGPEDADATVIAGVSFRIWADGRDPLKRVCDGEAAPQQPLRCRSTFISERLRL